MKHRILLYTISDLTDVATRYLEERGLANEFEVSCTTHKAIVPPTFEQLEGYDVVLGEFMPVLGETVDAFARAKVKLAASMSIGLNHMDVEALREKGVKVSNCPGYCADEVAEHTMALALDLSRQITMSNRSVLAGEWDPNFGYEMRRLRGQTMGLVFFGNIARKVASLAQAFGMKVLVWAPTKSAEELEQAGCVKVEELDDLLRESDFVSLHCPLIPMTEGLIGEREFSIMKPEAFLINTARGPIVQEDALIGALESHEIRGAALDVLADETVGNEQLINLPNCIVTPHCAYISREASEALVTMSLKSAIELLIEGRDPEYLV